MMLEPRLIVRPDGRHASRAYLLVVPAVACANSVAAAIASSVKGAVAVRHQHGCAQIGDDAVATTATLKMLAAHPNAWGTLIVSLGCETLQGTLLCEELVELGVSASVIGIQDEGGSRLAIAEGIKVLTRLAPARKPGRTAPVGSAPLAVGYVGDCGDVAHAYSRAIDTSFDSPTTVVDVSGSPIMDLVSLSLESGLLGLVLVADRGIAMAPVLIPTLAVAASPTMYDAAGEDYDLCLPSDRKLVAALKALLGGTESLADLRGDAYFAVPRKLLSL
jgi:hypothetical protein